MSIIQDMVTAAPLQVAATQKSLDQLQASIAVFQAKQDAIQNDVGDVIAADIEDYLIGTKFSPIINYHMYKGTDFNNILESSGSIIDWKIYQIEDITNLEFFNSSTFKCSGDQTSIFTEDIDLSFILNSTYVYSAVASSSYDAGTNKTSVSLKSTVLTASLTFVLLLCYTYTEADDTIIDDYKTNWDFAHDYIVHPVGLTGTYGTQDNIAKLTSSMELLIENKTKIDNSIDMFSQFVT